MNIHQKLIEVRKTCQYLKKDNKGYQFQFVSSSQTLGQLRGAMDEQGLLLVPSVEAFEVRDHTTAKGGHEYFTMLDMTFTWINADNPEETVVCKWTGQGLDNGEKGVGKALTYAEKYFLLKFFNIATDKDDPDAHQRKTEPKQPQPLITKAQALAHVNKAVNSSQLKTIMGKIKADCEKELSLDEYAEVSLAVEVKFDEFRMAAQHKDSA